MYLSEFSKKYHSHPKDPPHMHLVEDSSSGPTARRESTFLRWMPDKNIRA